MTRGSKKTVIISVIAVLAMFGFGFALVPLYDVFCEVTGINGKPSMKAAKEAGFIDNSRMITVQFLTTRNQNMPWSFYTKTPQVQVHPGERRMVYFYAKNTSNRTIVGQAIPSISPGEAARYLLKTECFCFNQQTLKAGEAIEMPMIFHIDPDLPKDIHTVTLSYTMFDAGQFASVDEDKQGKLG
ncbi:MAG: cytochrome c oxidase assembly protein [Gammaproteobacteria bacterium]|nr:cytochrome c oxidase assembly protein [Gammaproteobacteria bacterium]